jgi:serine/threonine-protein kinase/endoribonuclease IRE1
LQEVFPTLDFSSAAELDYLPNLKSAYVGMVEETKSLFAMSPDKFPLLAFSDPTEQRSIDQTSGTFSSSDLDAITQARKLRELCDGDTLDPRCMTGIHRLEADSRTRFNRLLDGTPRPPLLVPAGDAIAIEHTSPAIEEISNISLVSPWKKWNGSGFSASRLLGLPSHVISAPLWSLLALFSVVGWYVVKMPPRAQQADLPPVLNMHSDIVSGSYPDDTAGHVADAPVLENLSLSDSDTVTVSKLTSLPVADEPLEGEDSDKDTPDTTGKRKPIRRRRGRRKKGIISNEPLESNAHDNEETVTDELLDALAAHHQDSLVTSSSTPTKIVASPTLVVSDTVLGAHFNRILRLLFINNWIGFGSHGTVVFRGFLQGRAVAVKRLLKDFVTLASREVSLLEESDDHPNVIRYFYQETRANFLYIALELCPASLADIIERTDGFRDIAITFEPKRALRQITSGLRHLHDLKIVHRDIKPQNILVSSASKGGVRNGRGHRMLISDFGLCKKLEVDQSSFMPTAFGAMAAGTAGWRAPEILRGEVNLDDSNLSQSSRGSIANGTATWTTGAKPTKLTKTVDIFALGCLFFYTLTSGGHPFGDKFERESNILKDAKSLKGLEHFGEEGSEAVDLIHKMLNPEASQR